MHARQDRRRGALPLPLLFAAGIIAAPLRAEPLAEVVRFALQDHPQARASRAAAEARGFVLDQARAARLPQLALVADPGRGYARRSGAGTDVGDLSLRGSVMLYDGGRTRAAIEREQLRLDAARDAVRLGDEDLAARVTDLYLEWYRQEQLAVLAAGNVQAHEALYERVREIAAIDRGRASDLLQVGARLAQARVVLESRRGSASEARQVLAELAGREFAAAEAPRDPASGLPPALADALAGLGSHPLVQAAAAEAAVAQREARVAAAWARPRLDVLATLDSPTDAAGDRRYFDDYSLRIAATWAPFDGGAGRAAAHAAERQAQQADDAAQALRRELGARVTAIWAQLSARRERVQSYRTLVEQSGRVREAYGEQFTIGRRSIVDLLNAQNEAFQAQLAAEDERVQLLQSEHQLLATLAGLTHWLGVAPPPGAGT
ncbi:MAG: TolC family protein [Steroidobacteraceae bacterium]